MNTITSNYENKTKIIIPVKMGMANASVVVNGQIVKNLAQKQDVLEVMTNAATYTLPAALLDIDSIAQTFGQSVALSDISIRINISIPSDSLIAAAQNTAAEKGYSLAVPGFDFTIICSYGGKLVTIHSFDSFVKRTIAIPDGVDPAKISTAVVVEDGGALRHAPTKIISADGKNYAQISSLTDSTYSLIWNPVSFGDVTTNWSQQNINDLGARLVVGGVGDNNFNPDSNVTKAEFVKTVVTALGLAPGLGENKFSDVQTSDWFCGFCETALAYGIVGGYNDGTLRPNEVLTREQAMVILARALRITGLYQEGDYEDLDSIFAPFKDSGKISAYAADSVAACVKTGVVFGRSIDTIAPQENITRAEVAAIVERLLKNSDLI